MIQKWEKVQVIKHKITEKKKKIEYLIGWQYYKLFDENVE